MPALAMADIVKANCTGAEVLFVGGERGMERELVTAAGYDIKCLRVRGLSRSLTLDNFRVLLEMHRAAEEAKRVLLEFAPDAVIGTGGYACYPTVSAAAALGIPTALHESNAVPGLAIKRLAGRVDRVWINFPEAGRALRHARLLRVVGNPLREKKACEALQKSEGELCVLSFGGSLGAREINRAILALMEAERKCEKIRHLHATGHAYFKDVKAEFVARGMALDKRFELVPFVADMPARMAWADVVISRAGAISISELAAYQKTAVLIPSPNVTGNHQYKNARALSNAGAACLLEESELPCGGLIDTVMPLLKDAARRAAMSAAIARFSVPDANKRILAEIRELVRK
jgi:UDP-N-acetylglucosamine--N-acetylmuramyl-(pentapeptide) pyrophosphoryl-undecaprenol N-acetylglucosamine transferase